MNTDTDPTSDPAPTFHPFRPEVPRAPVLGELPDGIPWDLQEEALRALRAPGAGDRHRARAAAATAAAIHAAVWLTGLDREEERPRIAPLLILLLRLEEAGIGGPGGLAGEASGRADWAKALGKGRRHARDGAAWDAAILTARRILEGDEAGAGAVRVAAGVKEETPVLFLAGGAGEEELPVDPRLLGEVLGRAHARALALRLILGLGAEDAKVPGLPEVTVARGQEGWAEVLKALAPPAPVQEPADDDRW